VIATAHALAWSVLLVGPALFMIGMGLAALVRPAFVVGIFGVELPRAASRAEVRAVYGGYGVAVGALLLAAPSQLGGAAARGVALAIAASLGGMAVGRAIGGLVERQPLYPSWTFVAVELAIAGSLAAWAT
jgi:hypothetical protein